MKIRVLYPRKVVGGRMTSLDDKRMKSGPRLKLMVIELGHELEPETRKADCVINFGLSSRIRHDKIVNHPDNVSLSVNKLIANRTMKSFGVPIPRFAEGAEEFRRLEGKIIFKPFFGRCSHGKEIFNSINDVPYSPRFVNGFFQELKEIEEEWRVTHVRGNFPGFFLKTGGRGKLRSARFGWYYQRYFRNDFEDLEKMRKLAEIARAAVKAFYLDFGGVDIGIDVDGNYWVFEVNSSTFLRNPEARKIVNLAIEMFS